MSTEYMLVMNTRSFSSIVSLLHGGIRCTAVSTDMIKFFFFAFHSYNILCNNKFYCSSCSTTCSCEQCCALDTWHIQHMNAVVFDSRAFCCRRASLHPQANKLLPHSWGGFGVPYGDTASKSVWQRRRPGEPAILVNATGRNPGRRTRTTTMKRCWVTQFFITDSIFILSTQMAHWLLPTL